MADAAMTILDSRAATPPVIIDREALLDHFEGDLEFLQEIIALFIEDYPRRLGVLRDGLAHHDAAALYRAAHSIRGSVGNFGATEVAAAAARVEQLARLGDWTQAPDACTRLDALVQRLVTVLQTL